jgi:hypothetical protein
MASGGVYPRRRDKPRRSLHLLEMRFEDVLKGTIVVRHSGAPR